MENQSFFLLDTNILQEIPFDKYTKDFTFIVDGKSYPLSRFEADLISPIVRNLHFIDETQDYYSFNTSQNFYMYNFSDFLSLLSFRSQTIDIKLQHYVKHIFNLLGNKNECDKIHTNFIDTLQTNSVFQLIEDNPELLQFHELTNTLIDFIAIHFTELDENKLKSLDIEFLDRIIKNINLQIYDEDSLIEFIFGIYSEKRDASILFENIYYSNISQQNFERFLTVFDFNDFTSETWELVSKRILNQNDEKQNDQKESRYNRSFVYNKGNELNGIFKYLTDKVGGNLHDNKIIDISSSSNQKVLKRELFPNILCDFSDLSTNSMWSPNNEKNAYLIFDFKTLKIKLTDYTLHTPVDKSLDYPKSWIVECSNDKKNWDKADERKDESIMNNSNVCQTFHCQIQLEKAYQYIRITSNDACWSSSSRYYFDISAVEFFGTLIKSNLTKKKYKYYFF